MSMKETWQQMKEDYKKGRDDYLNKLEEEGKLEPKNDFKSTWHGFHLIMTLLTGLIWIPIWVWCTLSNNQHNRKIGL